MKVSLLIAVIIFTSTRFSFSQTSTSRIYIKGGENGWENLMKEVYDFPSFENGIVEYKDGRRYKSKLNYNRILGTVQFISEKNDTLVLANEEQVRIVTIGNSLFYYSPLCLKQVSEYKNIRLAKRETLHLADKQKVGAFGIPNASGTIDSYSRADGRIINMMDVNEALLLRKTTEYYLANDQHFLPVSKKNIPSLFPEHNEAIRNFLKEKGTDFHKEADVLRLAEFIGNL